MKKILLIPLLLLMINGCSTRTTLSIPIDRNNGAIYGTDAASCRDVKMYCEAGNSHGDPNLYREYNEWKDGNGNTMCSCK